MAKQSITILNGKIEASTIIDNLNAALSEEWIAYYQYWTAAQLVEGPNRSAIQAEFMNHANEELNHAQMVCKRIIELGGIPVTTPQQWFEKARCVYDAPTRFDCDYFLHIIKVAEECAMHRYQEIAELTEGKDFITNSLAKEILAEEADHEQEIQDFINDFEILKKVVSESM